MNILFFITPKSEIAYIYEDDSIRQALEKMEYHKFSAVPLLTRDGKYVGTITEGDMLWGIKNQYNLNLKEAEGISVSTLKRRMDYLPVFVKSNMEDMIDRALNQNFVPVLDDQKCFIGIITRKDIIQYFYKKTQQAQEDVKACCGSGYAENKKRDVASAVAFQSEKERANEKTM